MNAVSQREERQKKLLVVFVRNENKNQLINEYVFCLVQWEDKEAYKDTLLKLAGLFRNNFETFTSHKIGDDGKLTEEILAAGPNF